MKRILLFLHLGLFAAIAAEREPLFMSTQWSNYFSRQVELIENEGLANINSLEQWEQRRGEYRRQLLEMLGLWPMPERTALNAVITGKLEEKLFTVEKIHFQASPGLYVTANLYVPKKRTGKLPGVLYVCGHSPSVTNGISLGNKTVYQHHGAWFARNGYVCLTIDTIQRGEITGAHRGTYSEGQWWWNSVGYTPAGVEAWFAMRSIDYLCSRSEVDPDRIGMTGISGGGAYTWTVAALDDRVKVAAPVAGMTDLRNQVLDGVVDGHCDCMFQVNYHRWDFPMIGALIAPRPMMLGNSDKDRIFPLDGVLRTHAQIRKIYSLYGAAENFGLLITEGGHKDTQELQLAVFRWFNRFLKDDTNLVETVAKPFFIRSQLRVFDALPKDEKNTTAPEWFSRTAPEFDPKASPEQLRAALRKTTFAAWPSEKPDAGISRGRYVESNAVQITTFAVSIQEGIIQPLYHVLIRAAQKPSRLTLVVPGDGQATTLLAALAAGDAEGAGKELLRLYPKSGNQFAIFIPRGVGDRQFATTASSTRMRRRMMLLGQTLDGMRVWDICSAIAVVKNLPGLTDTRVHLKASGPMAVNAAFAALYQRVDELELTDIPEDFKDRPDYLGVLRITEAVPGGTR